MTEYYARPGFKLAGAQTSTKVLLTLFLITVLIAYGVAVVNQYVRSGYSAATVETYYRGSEEELAFPKPMREMLSVSHVHLFGMPILFFTLCHIFDLTSLRQRTKSAVFAVTFSIVMFQIASPWLVRYVSASLASFVPISFFLLTLVTLILVVVPLRETWFGPVNGEVGALEATEKARESSR